MYANAAAAQELAQGARSFERLLPPHLSNGDLLSPPLKTGLTEANGLVNGETAVMLKGSVESNCHARSRGGDLRQD